MFPRYMTPTPSGGQSTHPLQLSQVIAAIRKGYLLKRLSADRVTSQGLMFLTSCSRSPTPKDCAARVMSHVGSLCAMCKCWLPSIPLPCGLNTRGKHTKGVTYDYSSWLTLFTNFGSLYNVVMREQVQSILEISRSRCVAQLSSLSSRSSVFNKDMRSHGTARQQCSRVSRVLTTVLVHTRCSQVQCVRATQHSAGKCCAGQKKGRGKEGPSAK